MRGGEGAIPRHGRIRTNFQSGQHRDAEQSKEVAGRAAIWPAATRGQQTRGSSLQENAWLSTRCEHTLPHQVETWLQTTISLQMTRGHT